jgi:hypothetical protein
MEGWVHSRTAAEFCFPVHLTENECLRAAAEKYGATFFVAKATLYHPEMTQEDVKTFLADLTERIWIATGVDNGLGLKRKQVGDLTVHLNQSFQVWMECNIQKRLSHFWKVEPPRLVDNLADFGL